MTVFILLKWKSLSFTVFPKKIKFKWFALAMKFRLIFFRNIYIFFNAHHECGSGDRRTMFPSKKNSNTLYITYV